ncbi:MAG TPA: N-acetylmuramoyl-L-alanine amidase [Clostridiales bacterium]|nr:N-acetylmuramoyl-L-alanine amidase [Clostridiales bacterium]
MEKLLLKKAAIQSIALMLAVLTFSFALQQYRGILISADSRSSGKGLTSSEGSLNALQGDLVTSDEEIMGKEAYESENPLDELPVMSQDHSSKDLKGNKDEIEDQLGEKYIKIRKPSENISLELEDLYINKSIKLILKGLSNSTIDDTWINRVNKESSYTGTPKFVVRRNMVLDEDGEMKEEIEKDYGNDFVYGITINTDHEGSKPNLRSEILLELDTVYCYTIHDTENHFYIELKKPEDVYDKILVIDAGHGGKDAGALSIGEEYYEKNINLAIMLHLKEMLDKENIKVYYTRLGDDKVFLRPRVELANSVNCDFFISIHNNANVISSPSGTEVLYYDREVKGVNQRKLASIFLDELDQAIPLPSRWIIEMKKDDVFVLNHATVPAILIEVGYLTNPYDMKFLSKTENQKLVAQGIFNGIMRAYDQFKLEKE